VVDRRKDEQRPITLSVPEAGRQYFGLSRNGSYEAARRGDLPVLRVGRLLKVPVRALEVRIERAGATHRDVVPSEAVERNKRFRLRQISGRAANLTAIPFGGKVPTKLK